MPVLLLIGILFSPKVALHWVDSFRDSVAIQVSGGDQYLSSCLERGREAKVVYEVELCKRKPNWFDSCELKTTETHILQGDPLTGSYRLTSDRIGDKLPAVSSEIGDGEIALTRLQQVDRLPLTFFERKSGEKTIESYLSVRVRLRCPSKLVRVMSNLSSLLTLGLVDFDEEESGWIDFQL